MSPAPKKQLGDFLIQSGLITEAELRVAESEKSRWKGNLARALLEMHLIEEAELIPRLGEFMNLPVVNLAERQLDLEMVQKLGEEFCRHNECIVFDYDGRFLHVAMATPNDLELFDQIRVTSQQNVRTFLAGPADIAAALTRAVRGDVELSTELQFSLMNDSLLEFDDEGEDAPPVVEDTDPAELSQGDEVEVVLQSQVDEGEASAGSAIDLREFMRRTDEFLHALAWHLTSRGLLPPGLVDGQIVPYPGGRRGGSEPEKPSRDRRPTRPGDLRPATPPRPTPPAAAPGRPAPIAVERRPSSTAPEAPKEYSTVDLPAAPPERRRPAAVVDVTRARGMLAEGAGSPASGQRPPARVKPRPEPAESDMIVDLPPGAEEQAERGASGARPAAPAQEPPKRNLITSSGAGSAAASGEIRAAQPADPSAASAVLLELPEFVGEPVVAIDLGTTRSSVAMLVDNRVEVMRLPKVAILRLPGGEWDMPSVVAFRQDGSVMLGESARKLLATDPRQVVVSPKRLLGRDYQDPAIQACLANLAIPTAAGPDGEVVVEVRKRTVSIVEVCAHILNLLKLVAQRNLNRQVRDVVLSAPVTFGDRQFSALRRAAEAAGLNVIGFVDEPLAAALSNRYDERFRGLVAVYDFGGGTFDFTVLAVEGDGLRVLAKAGDAWLGGDDIDEALAGAAANAFWRQTSIELRNQATQWQRLRVAAEYAKRELSTRSNTVLRLPQVARTAQGSLSLSFPIARAPFARLCSPLIARSLETCGGVLKQAGVSVDDLGAVFVSGGTSYIPAVQQALVEYFGKVPRSAVPPERAVIVGAALSGSHLQRAQ